MSEFKVGDKVVRIEDHCELDNETIYTVAAVNNEVDKTRLVGFTWTYYAGYFKLYKEEEEVKQIKPEDEITVTTTYGELARVYAILGNANGTDCGKSLWRIASEAFNDSWEETRNKKFWEFDETNKLKEQDVLDYRLYQKEWEKLLFNQKSEKDLKIEELEKTVAEVQKQLQEFKEV